MKPTIIQTTCSDKKEAKKLAKHLIEKKLAACVQMIKIKSSYLWEDKFCYDDEILLNIKTKKENFKKIKKEIKKHHSYDVPEIIQIDISNMSKKYLKFMKSSLF